MPGIAEEVDTFCDADSMRVIPIAMPTGVISEKMPMYTKISVRFNPEVVIQDRTKKNGLVQALWSHAQLDIGIWPHQKKVNDQR